MKNRSKSSYLRFLILGNILIALATLCGCGRGAFTLQLGYSPHLSGISGTGDIFIVKPDFNHLDTQKRAEGFIVGSNNTITGSSVGDVVAKERPSDLIVLALQEEMKRCGYKVTLIDLDSSKLPNVISISINSFNMSSYQNFWSVDIKTSIQCVVTVKSYGKVVRAIPVVGIAEEGFGRITAQDFCDLLQRGIQNAMEQAIPQVNDLLKRQA